ncbi:MAG: M20/M25/M40 family metallo-hydrolase, partial [Cyclobacteriaceae bacterium]
MFKFLTATIALLSICVYKTEAQLKTIPQIEKATHDQFSNAVTEFREFLKIPNDGNYPEQIQANVEWVTDAFEKRGFKTQLLESPGAPHVYAQKQFVKNGKTVLFYLQIDGQPVDTSAWDQDSPFKATLKEEQNGKWQAIDWKKFDENFNPDWRIYARSASDSKGPAMCFLTALSILEKNKVKPNFNIKVIMDFQEELSSPQLARMVQKNKDLLQSDMVLIMDGTRHVSNLPTLCFGARGIATATIKIYGPRNALHSGQYGNYAPNPVFNMSKLLSGLKDDNGRVTLPGFYDGINLSDE